MGEPPRHIRTQSQRTAGRAHHPTRTYSAARHCLTKDQPSSCLSPDLLLAELGLHRNSILSSTSSRDVELVVRTSLTPLQQDPNIARDHNKSTTPHAPPSPPFCASKLRSLCPLPCCLLVARRSPRTAVVEISQRLLTCSRFQTVHNLPLSNPSFLPFSLPFSHDDGGDRPILSIPPSAPRASASVPAADPAPQER